MRICLQLIADITFQVRNLVNVVLEIFQSCLVLNRGIYYTVVQRYEFYALVVRINILQVSAIHHQKIKFICLNCHVMFCLLFCLR